VNAAMTSPQAAAAASQAAHCELPRTANRPALALIKMSAVVGAANSLDAELDAGRLPDLALLRGRFGPSPTSVPAIDVKLVALIHVVEPASSLEVAA
jgi:hypothetical protein